MPARSLRLRLILILSLLAIAIWGISTAIAWSAVRSQVNEVFDIQQILFAKRLASSDLRTMLIDRNPPEWKNHLKKRPHFRKRKNHDDNALAFAIFTREGEMLLSDGENGNNFLYDPKRGFDNAPLQGDSDQWRIFWLPIAEGNLMVAVGQELKYRQALIEKMVLGQMWIWFASLPLLLGVIIWTISRELAVLRQVSQQVSERRPDEAHPLDTQSIPTEILPLVESLNQFFTRTAASLLRERRFTADAAHELRSPLTALRIQTEIAQMAGEDQPMREQALQNLTRGIDRASQLVEQLLTLSRLDNLNQLENLQQIQWDKLIRSLIAERYFQAEKAGITLNFEQLAQPATQQGEPLLLSLMLRNVIDNGIAYCAKGSEINIILMKTQLRIEDNGGGVPDETLNKLGQRFYRPAGQNEKGSGLGLSIVQRIAELHHYKVRYQNQENFRGEKGFCVEIELAP
ncbi:quorum sensing histidine kinase QseC [Avibacterium paragallinarum]|uniref:Sensor protein QseC n=1 Tax=Avibacterium paragallinarum TaxID=728 RepID=A0AAE5WGV0_AVIPA|nr:quorum sensing histidine kinase QseC [Avibacterium paragallinarum]PXZ39543.1 two-component system sensor histidine kinase QseC [Avibacterium paragallinarum]PXZ42528.1 two-component system sensor histidine kinase QseC [Avibacterium paragallinarum]QZP16320.1 two-component system sensor histidine kinase QseC [Avibacterium paragallinarum]WAL57362.1 two-component system sensor histidine kinase QseC [Avibacterium paragallinarum]WAM60319.1 two-component system sensor histidine kinase QseC [Avibact